MKSARSFLSDWCFPFLTDNCTVKIQLAQSDNWMFPNNYLKIDPLISRVENRAKVYLILLHYQYAGMNIYMHLRNRRHQDMDGR